MLDHFPGLEQSKPEGEKWGRGRKPLQPFFSLVAITAIALPHPPTFQLSILLGSCTVNLVNVKFIGKGLSGYPFNRWRKRNGG